MRGFFIGLVLVVGLTVTILSLRPGGVRQQLRMAARRLRIFLVLGGLYLAASLVIRVFFPDGPVADYGPPAVAVVLALVFLIAAQDPAPTRPGT
jgi:peptidoglycan/LPS O-acetylase OafA/YrhL